MAEELTFNEGYEKLTTGTRAHADNFNKIFDLLLENDKFLKYAADSLSEKMIEKGMIVDNFATQIKGFIPDATLVTQLKEAQDEQNKNLSMNLTVPNYSEAITLSDSISTYTAPSNGYIRSELIRTGTNITYWIMIQVNGVRVFIINGSDTTEMGVAFIPVSKGDVITWKFENSQYCKSIYNMFIPCK